MIVPVITWPDIKLSTKCKIWDFDNPPLDSSILEENLFDTLNANNALGLAANQIGILYRVMLIHSQDYSRYITMYNPRIITASSTMWTHGEGCLSFPKIELTISRPKSITVEWNDKAGANYTSEFINIDAKCILHEIDHLDGIVFKKYVSPLKYSLAQKNARKNNHTKR